MRKATPVYDEYLTPVRIYYNKSHSAIEAQCIDDNGELTSETLRVTPESLFSVYDDTFVKYMKAGISCEASLYRWENPNYVKETQEVYTTTDVSISGTSTANVEFYDTNPEYLYMVQSYDGLTADIAYESLQKIQSAYDKGYADGVASAGESSVENPIIDDDLEGSEEGSEY